MKLEKFLKEVQEKVQEIVGVDACVHVQEVRKNNNVILHGMTILRNGNNVTPTSYLDAFFDMLKDGMDMENIVKKILEVYVKGLPKDKVDMGFFRDFEKVRERIVYRLVNREKNTELLADIPHVDFLDLSICFCYSYEHPELGEGMILIHNNHMEMWETCQEELMRLAEDNTHRLMPAWLCSMDHALRGMVEEETLEEMQKSQQETNKYLHVLSNEKRCYGATSILYPGMLAEAARRLKGSFYILPSSIHEVLLLTDDGKGCKNELNEMITDINGSLLQEEEVLSDHAYYYNALEGVLTGI